MTEREERHAALITAGNSAITASANARELWEEYRRLSFAFARDFPHNELPKTEINESEEIGISDV